MEWAWLIPVFSFAAAPVIVIFGKYLPQKGSLLAILAIGGGFVVFWLVFSSWLGADATTKGCFISENTGVLTCDYERTWFNAGVLGAAGSVSLHWGILIDPLTIAMLGLVTFVALMVQVYSMAYMKGDPRFGWYFAVHSLFAASMLTLVLADNFLLLYVAWELVGICSYLLIGFWHERPQAREAAKKAFIVTRIGDVGLLVGILLIWRDVGSFSMLDAFEAVRTGAMSEGIATASAILLFLGAMGKSAQVPFHVWLPDAMEGPTPVSALIHAATMVIAGVYLVARTFPLFEAYDADPLLLVAIVGLVTALMAATIALVATDLKRILAYSTISHLGLMMLSLGAFGYTAAIFHLMAHGFSKALLFLGAGSVLHSTELQETGEMGGLRKVMPLTAIVFSIGALSLGGIPILAGFWSKDEILVAVNDHRNVAFIVLAFFTALLSALYMGRAMFLVFFGELKDQNSHAHDAPAAMAVPLGNVGDAPVTATGFIAIADVDDDDSPAFNDVASTAGDNAYGSFTLTAGTWTYTLDQSAVQNLDAGDIVNDTITYTVTDGSTQQITVTINGTDDASVITGTVTGAVNEGNVGDAPVIASGSIAISDIDDDDSPTINDAGATASDNAYGSFTLTAGTWTYTLDQSAVQNLDANDVVNDTITYIATDGSTQQITITINGADDPAFIGGSDTGQVTEDLDPDLNTQLETSGSLTVSDLDAGEASFTAATVTGSYGQLSIDAAGNWSYTADNLQAAIQSLADGSTITDTVTITRADGTTHDIVIGILGVDDAPLVSAPAAAGTTNGNPLVFSGAGDNAITVDDVDANDLEVTLTATNGTVELASTNGLTFLVGDGSADTVMRFTGSSAAINAAMNGLSFQPDADFSGNASLRVAAADSGSGTLNTYETVNISVAAIAQTPAATTATQSLDELVFEYISETAIGGPGGANETPGIPGSTTNVESNHTSNPSTQTSLESGTTSSGGVQEINVSAFLSPSGITLSSASDGGAAMLEDGDGDSHETVHKLVKILLKDAVNGVQAILSINMEAAAWDMLSQVLDQMGDGVNSEPESPVFTAASNMTFTLTAGYVSWLLRAGYLSASLLSALPLWREFDPLPILAKKKNKKQRKAEQEAKDPDEMNDIPAEERIFESGN